MNGVVFLLEGADGAGKSTYAQRLADNYQAEHGHVTRIIHNGTPFSIMSRKKLFNLYLNQLEFAVLRRNSNVTTIIDRSFPSEWIYGRAFRGGSLLSRHQIKQLERYCDRNAIVRVSLHASFQDTLRRLKARGEPINRDDILHVGVMYNKYFRDNHWPRSSTQTNTSN